ncbi:TonB-dependent receptor [Polaribacter sp. Z014]|uniref:SusC/RagA family TonB-linked outer membrane protein n=1 Tax=Polaribacter sejongensis TaxID=985043 RepID=A0ABN5F9E2_9FLAO|nr:MULTISPECIES: TonB-dependent receptor [Polaribacter]AUC23449.1 SusC/RagA family TonB-linked outer membrane protein [Polaribacter sejongensis]MCL7762631.1 TonB-dependent receptor [Polaribacter sp. Z014]
MKLYSILSKSNYLLLFLFYSLVCSSQNPTVSGVIKARSGEPLPGVSVVVKGTTVGVASDFDGNYSISVPEVSTLVFRFIGYKTLEVDVSLKKSINVIMEEDINSLDEIVIVGYGTQKKSDITGTVASLDQERLESVPNVDISQAIQGAIPGISITTLSSGAAPSNDDTSIVIRGKNSILASNGPLVVVDGVPYQGQLRDINPNDVKSLEILKDASSAAIYGSRGANGVILITTKGGVEGKTVIKYDGYSSIQQLSNLPNLMDGEEFYNFKKDRDPDAITVSEQEIYDNKSWVSWPDIALRTGFSQNHNLSVSGGSKNTKFYTAFNLLDVKGIAKNDNYQRISTRVNLDTKINSWLTLGTRSTLTFGDQSGNSANFSDVFWMNPLTKPYNDDGSLNIYPWEEDTFWSNPLEGVYMENTNTSTQIVTNNFLNIEIPSIEGLQFRLNTGYRYRTTDSGTYRGRNTTEGFEKQGSSDVSRQYIKSSTIENILSYNKDLGKHRIGLTAVYSTEENERSTNSLSAEGYPNDILGWYGSSQASLIEPSYEYRKTNLISQMFRANYAFNDKYLFTFTVRRDGFSGFGEGKKWGTFPSVALGWNITNEDFFKSDIINNLKLRGSWGRNGNQAVGAYQSIAKFRVFDNVVGNTTAPGYIPSTLGNPNLSWETSESFNIGLDFGLLKNGITGDINYYNTNTSDLLLNRSISPVHGLFEITQNIGETNNSGIEVSVSSTNIRTDNFTWSTRGNIAFVKNKIVSLYGNLDENGNEIDDLDNNWFIGKPISTNYGFQYDGVWQTDEADLAAVYGTQPGYVKIKDVNGDFVINGDDRVVQGQRDPKVVWGLTNTLNYKNIGLNFFITGVSGNTKSNDLWNTDVYQGVRRNTVNRDWWTPTNPTNTIFANDELASSQGGFQATRYEDASFVRLRDITLSYDLSDEILKKLKLSKLKLYVTGRNLVTITDWTGTDPELGSQRSTPQVKEYVLGLNIGL